MTYDAFVLARGDLAAYWRLGDPAITSPVALSFPGADNTAPGVHVNDLTGAISLNAGDILVVHLTGTMSGGTNPNIGFFSAAGGHNYYTDNNPPAGWYCFEAPSTRSDYFIYVYTGGSYAAGLTGSGSFGQGGASPDQGPNNLGYLTQRLNSGTPYAKLDEATLLGGGQTGGSVKFTGTNMWLYKPDAAALDLGDSWSAMAIIYPTSLSGQRAIVSKGNGAYYMRTNGTDLEAVRSLVAVLASSTGTLSINTRYHVAVTKNGSTRKVYVNGVDVTDSLPADSTTANNAAQLHIGHDSGGSEDNEGWIAEVSLHNGPISGADVALAYAEVDTPTGGGGSSIPEFQAIVVA